jgi:ADP-heptose:LPS heptosyltransferase
MKLSELRYDDQRYPDYARRKIIVHPGSGSPLKNWPLPNFQKLFKYLTSERYLPEIILGPAEENTIEDLKDSKYPVHVLTDLLKLADILKSAGGYIGNDSGVTHLSAYLGVPTVAIFGPSNPLRWQPVGKTVGVVTPDVDCNHCFETQSDNCKSSDCLNSISFQRVMDTFLEIHSR